MPYSYQNVDSLLSALDKARGASGVLDIEEAKKKVAELVKLQDNMGLANASSF